MKPQKCCANCANKHKPQRYDYKPTGGVDHVPMEGFICSAMAHEGYMIWMTGDIDENVDYCEEWREKGENMN